jgi:D-alanine-D-alanine ligase
VHFKIAVIYNKLTAGEEEANASVRTDVEAVHQALNELGHSVVEIPLLPPFAQAADTLRNLSADLVFNLFEGFINHSEAEATIAGVLAETSLPYTGCTSAALALALDKPRAKALMNQAAIASPKCQLLSPETLSTFDLGYPCIVKPRREDASYGLSEDSVVCDYPSLQNQVSRISRLLGGMAMVEEFLDGREFNATIMGNDEIATLPISEIAYSVPPTTPRILTYAAKWDPNSAYFKHTKHVCPAQIGSAERARMVDITEAVFRSLVGHGYARVDMRMDAEGEINVLEVNPNPDISPDAGAARQAQAAGMTYSQFIENIVMLAL